MPMQRSTAFAVMIVATVVVLGGTGPVRELRDPEPTSDPECVFAPIAIDQLMAAWATPSTQIIEWKLLGSDETAACAAGPYVIRGYICDISGPRRSVILREGQHVERSDRP